MSIDMNFYENLNNNRIVISNKPNKYYQDYSNVPEDAIIKYGKDWDEFCEKKEFLEYQRKIIELKQIFRKCNLSPIEKLMVAYDLVKSKQYNLSDNESLNGLPHEVLSGEHISCRGYCNLLMELLDSEGIKITNQELTVYDKNGNKVDRHARCTVILDDEKYNIHGLFVVSPTEDSYKESNKMYLGNDLQKTDLYSWFLRPLRDSELYHSEYYEYRINNIGTDDELLESLNSDGEIKCYDNPEYKINELIEKSDEETLSILYEEGFDGLLDGLTKEQILQYINTDYIDFNLMLEVIANVRRTEGYSEEQIAIDLERITRINSNYFPEETEAKSL